MEADEKWRHLTEKDGVLPGSLFPAAHPTSPVPLRSANALSHPGGKRISTHSVTLRSPPSELPRSDVVSVATMFNISTLFASDIAYFEELLKRLWT